MRNRLLAAVAVAAAIAATLTVPTTRATAGDHRPGPGRDSCARSGLLFCENFDAQPLGGPNSLDWGVDTRQGTLTVERDRHRGGRLLHVRTEENGHAFLTVTDLAPRGNSFYGRIRLKVAAFPSAPDWAHYTLVEATGAGPGFVRPVGGQYVPTLGQALWGVGSDGGPTGDWTDWQPTAPSAAGRWQCIEWQFAAADNRVSVWIDGRPKPELTVSTRDHGGNPVDFVFPAFDTVKIGWQLYQGDPTPSRYDVWYDDIALGQRRLGCR